MAALMGVAVLTAAASHAQFQQYIAPGSLAIREVPTKDRVEAAMKDARYHLGPIHLATVLGLNNVTYTDNVYGTGATQVSDISATVTAGLQGYLPVGRKLVVGAYVLPQYTWWKKLDYLRSLGGQYGFGLFGYFNRVTIEVQGSTSRTQQYFSSENMVPVTTRNLLGSAALEFRVLRRLSVFASGIEDRTRYEDQPLASLPATVYTLSDRTETQIGGGLRYRFRPRIMVGLGYGTLRTDFLHELRSGSNSGNGPFLELQLQGKRLWTNVHVSNLLLEAKGASDFVRYSGPVGLLQMGWRPSGNIEVQLYGGRYLSYTLVAPAPYYVDSRVGTGVQGNLGWRTTARLYVERGRDRYAYQSDVLPRTDDFTVIGTTIDFKIGRRSGVTIGGSRTDYTSDVAGATRSIPMFQLSLRFAGSGVGWW